MHACKRVALPTNGQQAPPPVADNTLFQRTFPPWHAACSIRSTAFEERPSWNYPLLATPPPLPPRLPPAPAAAAGRQRTPTIACPWRAILLAVPAAAVAGDANRFLFARMIAAQAAGAGYGQAAATTILGSRAQAHVTHHNALSDAACETLIFMVQDFLAGRDAGWVRSSRCSLR